MTWGPNSTGLRTSVTPYTSGSRSSYSSRSSRSLSWGGSWGGGDVPCVPIDAAGCGVSMKTEHGILDAIPEDLADLYESEDRAERALFYEAWTPVLDDGEVLPFGPIGRLS